MKRILAATLKSLTGTVIALALLEVGLRLLAPAPIDLMRLSQVVESERGKFAQYDSLLGWDGKPNVSADFEWIDTSHHVSQNRFGYRGGEYDTARTVARRVLVLGDSFVWGFGVRADELFTSVMEGRSARPLEVVNVGVSGFGTDQELLLWRSKAHDWQPDAVVLVVTPYTDIVDNLFDKRYGYPKPRFVRDETGGLMLQNVPVPRTSDFAAKADNAGAEPLGAWAGLLRQSHLAKRLVAAAAQNPGLRRKMESRRLIPRRLPGYDWERPLYQKQPRPQTAEAWDIMLGLIGQLKTEVEASGATFTVAIVPSIVQVYPDLWQEFAAGPGAEPEVPNRILGRWCAERGVAVLDLLPAFREAGKGDPYLYYPYNRHWTAAGHLIVGQALMSVAAPNSNP